MQSSAQLILRFDCCNNLQGSPKNTFQCQNTSEPKTRIEMKIILKVLKIHLEQYKMQGEHVDI